MVKIKITILFSVLIFCILLCSVESLAYNKDNHIGVQQTHCTKTSITLGLSNLPNKENSSNIVIKYNIKNYSNVLSKTVDSNTKKITLNNLSPGKTYVIVIYYIDKIENIKYTTNMEGYTIGHIPTVSGGTMTNYIVNQLKKGKTAIKLPYAADYENFVRYLQQLSCVNPEIFVNYSVTPSCSCIGNAVIFIKYRRISNRSRTKQVNTRLNSIIVIAKRQPTTYKKIEYVENQLCRIINYNKNTKNSTNAYGAIIQRKATCMGYSSAFSWCMHRLKIPVSIATNSNHTHIWNKVKIGKRWYHVDVTWDDYGKVKGTLKFKNLKGKTFKQKRYTNKDFFLKTKYTDRKHR